MASSYFCGSMPFLTEKEAVEMWANSDLFTSILPKDATPHSFDYIRRMVAESKKKSRQEEAKKAALLEQQQEELLNQHGEEEAEDEDNQNQQDAALNNQQSEEKKLVFELTTDEETLELFAQEVQEEEEETIRKQKALNEGEDGLEDGLEDKNDDVPENDANAPAKKKGQTKSGANSAVNPPSSPTTKTNENESGFPSSVTKQQQQNDLSANRSARRQNQQVDIEVIAEALGLKPNTHERYRGRIKTFLGDHGYGFIQPYAGVEFMERRKRLEEEFHKKRLIRIQQMKKNELQEEQQLKVQEQEVEESTKKETNENDNNENKNNQDGAEKQQQQGESASSETEKAKQETEEQQEEEEQQLPPLLFNPLALEIFISVEDVLTLGAASTMIMAHGGGGHHHQQHRRNRNQQNNMMMNSHQQDPQFRALRIPLPGEEVEFSVVIAQTQHGRSLRAVRLTGPNGSPLVIQTSSMRQRGIIRLWDAQRKFGFITPLTNGPPPGLAALEDGRLPPETVQALRKKQSGDVFTLASNVIWDSNAAPTQTERFIEVGSIVEYTAVLRKFQQQGSHSNNNNSNKDDANSKENNRLVAICVTDVGYRPLDPNILERTIGIDNLNQLLSSIGIGGGGGGGSTGTGGRNRHQQQQNKNENQNNNNNSANIGVDLATLIANGTIQTARPDTAGFGNNNNSVGGGGGMMMMMMNNTNNNSASNNFGLMGSDLFGNPLQQQQLQKEGSDGALNNNNKLSDGSGQQQGSGTSGSVNDTTKSSVADLFGGNMTW